MDLGQLHQVDAHTWEIPQEGAMRVPGRLFATEALVRAMDNKVFEQVRNVATLPGIVSASLAMPDAHWGYGFPIGGVAAFDEDGIVCMGGVGYDISCGVRLVRANIPRGEVSPKVLGRLADDLFTTIPAGLGSEGAIKVTEGRLEELLDQGARFVVEQGYGRSEDLPFIEELGSVPGADPSKVSAHAKRRQRSQLGTLGSGNHYLEVQQVDAIHDSTTARVLGLRAGELVISIHCGSRGLGHQIATDYQHTMAAATSSYGFTLPDRELVGAPLKSAEGLAYLGAMRAAINYALANRQVLTDLLRQSFERVLPEAELEVVYDVSHNTCKEEEHVVDGHRQRLWVHRKGATRALGPGWPHHPSAYESIGQPVFIGGSMGTSSYVLAGTSEGMRRSFGSACHGAGRALSRTAAKQRFRGDQVVRELAAQGILVRSHSVRGVAEEAPGAYKDVGEVVAAVEAAGLSTTVARLLPVISVKG